MAVSRLYFCHHFTIRGQGCKQESDPEFRSSFCRRNQGRNARVRTVSKVRSFPHKVPAQFSQFSLDAGGIFRYDKQKWAEESARLTMVFWSPAPKYIYFHGAAPLHDMAGVHPKRRSNFSAWLAVRQCGDLSQWGCDQARSPEADLQRHFCQSPNTWQLLL